MILREKDLIKKKQNHYLQTYLKSIQFLKKMKKIKIKDYQ